MVQRYGLKLSRRLSVGPLRLTQDNFQTILEKEEPLVAEKSIATPTSTTPPGGEPREMKLRIDESEMLSAYANTIRSYSTQDEVFLDFGMNLPVPGKPDEIIFRVKQQSILNWRTTKRLALSLSSLIRQHEERFGEIDAVAKPKSAD